MFHQFVEGRGAELSTPRGADFSQAVRAAQSVAKAFVDFRKTSYEKRQTWARAFLAEVDAQRDDLSALLIKNLGYPADLAEQEVTTALATAGAHLSHTLEQAVPVGPALVFGSWSSPVLRTTGSVLTALVNGNTVLLQGSAAASPVYTRLGELLVQSGFPLETFAFVGSEDPEAIDTLYEHPALRAVHFSGHFYEGENLRRRPRDPRKLYKASFGGHNPVIFLHDAPLENLRDLLLRSLRFHFLGERRFNRWFVQEKNFLAFTAQARELVAGFTAEDIGRFPDAAYADLYRLQAGDLQREKNWASAPGQLEKDSPRPALSYDFNNCSPWQQAEVLGPVLTLTRFKNSVEAVKFCNTTFFADAACVFSSDEAKSRDLAAQLNMPLVTINKFYEWNPAVAGNGIYESGFGNSETDFDFFRQKKVLR